MQDSFLFVCNYAINLYVKIIPIHFSFIKTCSTNYCDFIFFLQQICGQLQFYKDLNSIKVFLRLHQFFFVVYTLKIKAYMLIRKFQETHQYLKYKVVFKND